MIVRPEGADLLLITQPDHAALAGRLMREWRADGFSGFRRRDTVLLAIDEHDNGWREPDRAPMVDHATGAILDFVSAPLAVRRGVWPRGVEHLAGTPYAAALVAQHAIHVYSRYRDDEDWQAFFNDMEQRRAHYLARAGELDEALLADYAFVRIGDLLSLTFCNAWDEEQRHGRYQIRLSDQRLVVMPDPFDGREIAFEITARRLPNRRYASDEDARGAYDAAPHVTLTGAIAGA